jgi:hypothetical protein
MGINSTQLRFAALFGAASVALTFSGCKSTAPVPTDATLTEQVQGKLAADQNLSGQNLQAQVASGVAVLSGSVTSDMARAVAGGDAAQVAGIKTVVNNLTVQPAANASAASNVTTPPPAPVAVEHPRSEHQDRDRRQDRRTRESDHPEVARNGSQQQDMNPPAPIMRDTPPPMQQQAQQPALPPPPVVRTITLSAGTVLPVRITQTLDSASSQQGDRFTGVVAADVVSDGIVVLPQGTPVTGHVDAVQDATHFSGNSLLTVSLTSVNRRGEHIDIATEPYTAEGKGRGKNTAEKVGGGAALGAILGGIFGGGKGAAIGGLAGGGVGAGAQAATRGQQVQIPSETILRFKLTKPAPVRVTPGGAGQPEPDPTLQRRTQ